MDSTTSSWVNLDSDISRLSGSGEKRASTEAPVQEKLKQLEQTVATLPAQLQTPQSSTPKITALIAIVELVKDTIPTEVLVATNSPHKRGRGECLGLFEPQVEQIEQLPWHEDKVCVFEACTNEISHSSSQTKRDQPSLWMDNYLKGGKSSQTCCSYFKLEGAASTLYPARVNANLTEISNGPLKDKQCITEKDTSRGQVPKNTLRPLRTSQLLGDLIIHISSEDLENLKKDRNECYMFQMLNEPHS